MTLEQNAPQKEEHFTDAQEKSELVGNVAKVWADQCISFDTLMEQLQTSQDKNFDVHCQLRQMELIDDNGQLRLQIEEGEQSGLYSFGQHASNQICSPGMLRLGTRMLTLGETGRETEHINRLYIERFQAWRKNVGSHKQFFVRLRDNEGYRSVRAILSDNYTNIPHTFLADTLKSQIGGDGLISHFDQAKFVESEGDYCRYNVLIPDSVRAEEDSDYGGMESISNSEVGTGRYLVSPSIFRAICMNGCIWGQRSDETYVLNKVHKGKINLELLREEIIQRLQNAIPLMPQAIDNMLGLKGLECNNTMQLLGFLSSSELQYTKDQRSDLLLASGAENLGNNAFAVVNAFTRYAQSIGGEGQQQIEETAGSYLQKWSGVGDHWERVTNMANQFDLAKELSSYSTGA